jgi:hypothetical protein
MFFPLAGMPPASFKTWAQAHGPVDAEFSEGESCSVWCPDADVRAQARFSVDRRALWRGGARPYHDHYYLAHGMPVDEDGSLVNALLLLFPSRVI